MHLQFRHSGRRYTARLGDISQDALAQVQLHVRRLVDYRNANLPPEPLLRQWALGTGGNLRSALVRAGLIESEDAALLSSYLMYRIDNIRCGKSRRDFLTLIAGELVKLWGDRPLFTITRSDGLNYRDASGEGNRQRRRVAIARRLMAKAVDRGLMPANPFEGIDTAQLPVQDKKVFVPVGDVELLLSNCEDPELRLIICLSRFGALRIPSEIVNMTWEDFDFDEKRFVVRDSKRQTTRMVPMFAQIVKALHELHDATGVCTGLIFTTENRDERSRRLIALCKLSGLKPWRSLWHSMRASRATELEREFGLAVSAKFCGHSPRVSLAHYQQVTPEEFRRAAATP